MVDQEDSSNIRFALEDNPKGVLGSLAMIKKGLDEGFPMHEHIRQLMPYSQYVSFIVKVRNCFLNLFEVYKDDFPGIDGEAFFIGTVMHGLDHTQFEHVVKDCLWLKCSVGGEPDDALDGLALSNGKVDGRHFLYLEELTRFVRCGFTTDLSGIIFTYRFKDHTHPFFKSVYRFAHKLNPRLADNLDCCIIK